MSSSMTFDNLSSLAQMKSSESFSDLNAELNNPNQQQPSSTDASSTNGSQAPSSFTSSGIRSSRSTHSGLGSMASKADDNLNNKPFGLGKLNTQL